MTIPRKFDLNAIMDQKGVQAELQLKTPEDPEEKTLRLHRVLWSFRVKELGPYLFAALTAGAVGVYSLVILERHGTPSVDRDHAWASLSAILGWLGGLVFGRVTSK